MARQLKATVYLHDADGVVRGFGPGDIVPDWVVEQITNPDVWADAEPIDDIFIDDEEPQPPKSGRGSGLDAWLVYAEKIGVDVPEGANRDEVIAAVESQ